MEYRPNVGAPLAGARQIQSYTPITLPPFMPLTIYYCLFTIHYFLLTIHYFLLTIHYLPFTFHFSTFPLFSTLKFYFW